MNSVRGRTKILIIAITTMIVGGVAMYLLQTQAQSRAQLQAAFHQRASLAANLTSATIAANLSEPSELEAAFGGGPAQVTRGLAGFQGQSTDPLAAVIGAHGRVIATWPTSAARLATTLRDAPDVQRALSTGSALSNILFFGPKRTPMLRFSEAFNTRYGRRVFVDVTSAGIISVASAFLSSAPAVPGARAYLVDGAGRLLASSTRVPQAAMLPNPALARAIGTHMTGDLGASYFVTASIRASSDWRVVFIASRASLYSPVNSSKRAAWLLFAGFVLAVLTLLGVAGSAMRKSAQLAAAQEREDAAQRLAHERLHDALTGLPNRALFLDRTEHALARMSRHSLPLAVLFVDLDHFKRINDSLGHSSGDELLALLATRLRGVVRPTDTVSRFGGDEFLVLCEELRDDTAARAAAARIRNVLEEPCEVGGRQLRITCCVGVALQRPDAPRLDAATLVRDADAAMYSAKSAGRAGVKVFDEGLHRDAVRRLDAEVALRAAVENEELEVHYQPIVELPGGGLRGVEALARWTRPGVGRVAPDEFIKLAEECGLIEELGASVLATAMAEVGSWYEAGLIDEAFSLSVNVSPRQLANPEFPSLVARQLETWTLPRSSLCLEITESAVVSEACIKGTALTALHELGVQLAIDDFGIGQSSLEQLVHSLPVDVLKLDRAFVADMDHTRERAVVAAVAPMAKDLGMSAIAEGVETAEQAAKLADLGYPLAQGYHFGRPEEAARIRATLLAEADPLLTT